MTNWVSEVCDANGITIRYLRTGGAKTPVVLLHGLMGSGACWTPLARALEAEFDVIMPDARGHGGSSAPLHGYRYDDLANDVVGLISALELSRPVLLGHSMGGMTAAVVASRGAGIIRGLILVDPTFLSPERQREVRDSDVADQHRRALGLPKSDLVAQARARHPHRWPELIELQAEARLATRLGAFDVLTPPNPEYRDLVSAIEVPSLLVIGDSPVVTLEMAMELRSLNSRVRIEQVEDAGHGLPFEQPERLGELVVSFLRNLVAAVEDKMQVKRQLLFVQGGGKGTHDEWDNKLVESLRRELGQDYEIHYPRMPNEDDPNYASWKTTLEDMFETLRDDAILVAHSVGGAILLKALAERTSAREFGAIFLIAAPFVGNGGWSADDLQFPADLGARLPEGVPIHFYHGLDDEVAPPSHLDLYARAVPQARVHRLSGRDHQLNDDLTEVAAAILSLETGRSGEAT